MRGFVKYLLLLWAGILAASCVFDADQCGMPVDEPRSVMFTVSLDNHRTKATWGEDYSPKEEGVPFDFRLIPEDLRVVVFAQDGKRIGTIQNLDYWPIDDKHTQFHFIGQMPEGFAEDFNSRTDNHNYKFMVLANCGDNMSGEQYITYSHTQLDPRAKDSAIPMWGVSTVDLSSLQSSGNKDIGSISLLRAAAKIEVKLSETMKSKATIKSATLKYYNQTGYVLPTGGLQAASTTGIDQESGIRVYRHAAVNLPFIEDTDGSYYVYVTEYDNVNYSGERNKISLEFIQNGVTKTFEDAISFCTYNGGKPVEDSHYNIVRNHIYEFEITGIAGSNLVLDYTVADWTAEDWDGNGKEYEEHDLTYPTYHNPVVPIEFFDAQVVDKTNYIITKSPEMYFAGEGNEKGGFHCYFQILAPATVAWKPVFMGSTAAYRIRVYTKGTDSSQSETLVYDTAPDAADQQNSLTDNLGPCGSGEWYHIVVFPIESDGAGSTEIDFGITYYQSWTEQYINLYINGEYGNIRWPDSGDNPKLIRIKHVSAPTSNTND